MSLTEKVAIVTVSKMGREAPRALRFHSSLT